MAVPKVFVSSTCFDLGEVRDQLNRFIRSFGFDPVLSEHGDVFYHPDLHTHESCIHEVANCQLFILIIGGRFGGEYISDKEKSITNAEYDAARENNIPVFTYIRKNVLSNQHIYKENRKKKFVSEIEYPSIDKQEYAIDIFNFIDSVKKSPVNNAFEGFDNFLEIETHLRKQWAGMFFDFLKTREVKSQIDATNHLLSGIKSSSGKLEELVKSLYRSVAKEAESSISTIDVKAIAKQFFNKIIILDDTWQNELDYINNIDLLNLEKISSVDPKKYNWHEYLVKTGLFNIEDLDELEEGEIHISSTIQNYGLIVDGIHHQKWENTYNDGVKLTSKAQRLDILVLLFRSEF